MPVDLHVVTPQREVWAGDAEMVIARGVDGEVGILGGHAPLLIQLAVGPLRIIQEGAPELRAVVDGGFMHVTSGSEGTRVDVMASEAELQSEIDFEAAARVGCVGKALGVDMDASINVASTVLGGSLEWIAKPGD